MVGGEANSIIEEKRRLRGLIRRKRALLSPQEQAAKSRALCEGLADLLGIAPDECDGPGVKGFGEMSPAAEVIEEFPGHGPQTQLRAGDTIALYSALENEADLSHLIKRCYAAKAHVVFPCMNPRGESLPMCMRKVEEDAWKRPSAPFLINPLARLGLDDERLAAFPVVEPEEIDAIVVPLVAFDDKRRRLGYGGGNYDSYLPLLAPRCLVAGAAFREQRVASVPAEPHDLALPAVVFV